jgi:hypothetical protein
MQRIVPAGTQIVAEQSVPIIATGTTLPQGAVGVIVRAPADTTHSYRIRFVDGSEASLGRDEFRILHAVRESGIGESAQIDWTEFIIFRCITGSRAYGLETAESDVDRRGIYLPPADLHWALYGVPEQFENDATQEVYWELEKFLKLALKANPGILECLYSPLVEEVSDLAQELLSMRESCVSKRVYAIRWKHPMHLIRLLLSGVTILREGTVPVRVDEHRERLLSIRRGEMPWEEVDEWRLALHRQLDDALTRTALPERPDFERANAFLLKARRSVL